MDGDAGFLHVSNLSYILNGDNIWYTHPMDRPEDTLVPTADPLAFEIPSQSDVHRAYRQMIISSSGWRTVFAKSGDEEDSRSAVAPANRILTALAAVALYRFLDRPTPTILVGLDARPTGSTLGPIVIRTLLSLGAKVRYLAITPAPQIMADTNLASEEADAFFYISASHNPIGHNGFKFGKAGGVFGSAEATALAEGYEALVNDWEKVFTNVVERSATLDSELYKAVFDSVGEEQKQSARRYRNLALQIATKSEEGETHRAFIDTMKRSQQIGILGELNGSARSVSIDRTFLPELGVKTHFINDTPGVVVHPIVPEGENLNLCMESLRTLHEEDSTFILGYVPDNDGDRGNIVYITDEGIPKILEAQSLFALIVLAELAQSRINDPSGKLAVVVNGPTSMRVDEIAHTFNAEVFRSEVGEANVVQLAEAKRKEGYSVPILGEGSNGGNISYPAKVRDPLNTLLSLVKLLNQKELSALWFEETPHPLTLDSIIASLPPYITTGAYSAGAKMKVDINHGILKNHYEAFFDEIFHRDAVVFRNLKIHSYQIIQTEGTEERIGQGVAYRTAPYSGGFKVALYDENGVMSDYLWMRGSKTEPIFRLLVDCKGSDQERHDYLLELHRSIIVQALLD